MAKKKKNVATKVKTSFKNVKQNLKKSKTTDMTTVTMNMGTKKKRKAKVGKIILILFMMMAVMVATAGLAFCIYIIIKAPEFDVSKLYKSSSSIIYDVKGDVIAELGVQKRENVTYDRLPDVLVDAIVATEDSKFFRHSGIDLLRFGKAVAGQLVGQSDAGGGSTLTMQIVKNTYNGTETRGIKGIIRKFTDIYMSVFKVEKTYTKQEIIEFYVNQAFLGSGAYGVSQAADTFFGKDVEDLNLSEAATIAGLFQAPTAYDPYVYPDKAQARRDRVLDLMVRHGYITKEESAAAKAINVKDMLTGYSYSYSKYQGIVDTVASDVYSKTGYDPYVTSMKVYTTFDLSKQDAVDKIYNSDIKWPNEVIQCGLAITDVRTGAIVAIGTGRNRNGEKQFNYATSINRHPGSTAKPIFDYGPAIEYEGWGTGTMLIDDVYSYTGGVGLHNVDRRYDGILTAKVALAKSRNIPALQAFQATSQEDKYEFITNLGIKPELYNNEILESSSIGAFNGVSPLQMSAAYAAFGRGGYYIEPYTFTKVEYNDSNETYTHTPTRVKVMSEETAYMINDMLKYAVSSNIVHAGSAKGRGDVAGKTGTSSVDGAKIKQLNLRNDPINDSWQVVYSPDYSIAYWLGYDQLTKEHYLTINGAARLRNKIGEVLSPRIITKGSNWEQPSGITSVTIERESNMLASEFTPDDLKTTEYYKKGTEPTEVSFRFKQLDDVSNLTYSTFGNQVTLSWTPIQTPNAIDETFLHEYFQKNYANNEKWVDKYYNRRLAYNAANIGTLTYEIFVKYSDGTMYSIGTTPSNSFTTSITNASSATYVVKSTYTIFRGNASPGREISVRVSPSFVPTAPSDGNDNNDDQNEDNDNDTNNNNNNNNNNENNNN